MKLYHWTILAVIIAIATWSVLKTSDTEPRAEVKIDLNWRFLLGDNEAASKTEFNDTDWQIVSLPHDWMIEQPLSRKNKSGKAPGFYPEGVGWYRKHLDISRYKTKKQFYLVFDGVNMNSDVWINGNHLGNHKYGYIGFQYDITPFLRKDTINIIAVRTDCSKLPTDKWYSGAGIYRHVKLIASERLHFPEYNTRISTKEVGSKALVTAEISVTNYNKKAKRFKIKSDLLGPNGSLIQSVLSTRILAPGESTVVTEKHTIEHPKQWSPDTPHLYELHSFLLSKKKITDDQVVRFGVRTAEFNQDSGFILNGEKFRLKGVYLHQDGGELGAAIPDVSWEYRLNQLKLLGVNALRLAQNPYAPEVLDMCDRMGFLVIDEMYNSSEDTLNKENGDFEFTTTWKEELEYFIKRDINHPSVILWNFRNGTQFSSLEMALQETDMAMAIIPVSSPCIDSIIEDQFIQTGIDHLGETVSWPGGDVLNGLLGTNGFIKPTAYYTQSIYSEEPMVKMVVLDEKRADSLKNATDWQVRWSGAPVVRHWTFPLDSEEKQLVVFTNCEQVELQLNSKPAGNLNRSDFEDYVIKTKLAYEPGILVATAFVTGKKGVKIEVSDTLRTAGKPSMIMMKPDKLILLADGMDVMHIETSVRDSAGTIYPTADHMISYSVDGPGKIAAIDNGDPSDHDAIKNLSKRVKKGRHLVILRSTLHSGDLTISAKAEGLSSASVKVKAVPPSK